MRKFALSAAIVLVISATANASATSEAQKICLDRYNMEKSSNSIPAGMSKSKYMSQCTNSIRRSAQLEQDLQAQGQSDTSGGANEETPTATGSKPAGTTSKPSRVKTTLSIAPVGH